MKPTVELIQRLHRENLERQAAIHGKLNEIHQRLMAKPAIRIYRSVGFRDAETQVQLQRRQPG